MLMLKVVITFIIKGTVCQYIDAMQSRMISQPVKSLTKRNFTKYTIKMLDHGQRPTIMYEL